MAGGNFDAPVTRHKQSVAAQTPQAIVNNVFAALPEPAPVIAAPATIASTSTLRFDDRFAAAAPQGVAPRPQAETMQLASASPSVEVTKPVDAPKLLEAVKPKQASPAPAQVAALTPAPAETKPAKSTGASVKDMAQRAKAAVMSIASGDRPNMVEKLWGKEPASRSLLSYASADVSATGSLPKLQNPMLGGSPPYDRATAVYDIAARKVYLPDGTVLEAHSGLGAKKDDVRYAHVRMQGVTPPHIYDLKPREALFHGVPALRLTPIGGQDKIFNRDGLLAHTYMLGSGGDSNGCISFKDYYAFLDAYRKGGIRRIAVLARVE
ncbi:MAG TPA: tlde1 domain-containing protein [Bradyrhizobium sp.]|nr:tlde1 domain-containing protein [Bradyrhizobium sp.]